ncbi:MAG: protease-like activity factor CPAF [Myxococcota bacterium]
MRSYQLAWKRAAERIPVKVSDESVGSQGGRGELGWAGRVILRAVSKYSNMSAPGIEEYRGDKKSKREDLNPFAVGSPISFVPKLGPDVKPADFDSPFFNYIYRHPQVGNVGFVRIPTFSVKDPMKNVEVFAELIEHFEKTTDALVIDMTNNGGGSVFYTYALLSMLSNQALATPQHRMAITSEELKEAAEIKEAIRIIRATRNPSETAKKTMGKSLHGYPVNADTLNKIEAYADFLLSHEVTNNADGPVLTRPFHLWAADKINPSTQATYTKPIVLLINEKDFSAADFSAEILKQNNRALLYGNNTGGAGGYVLQKTLTSRLGVAGFSVTGSVAAMPDEPPIEGRGVAPHIVHKATAEDFSTGFTPYGRGVNMAVMAAVLAHKKNMTPQEFIDSLEEKAAKKAAQKTAEESKTAAKGIVLAKFNEAGEIEVVSQKSAEEKASTAEPTQSPSTEEKKEPSSTPEERKEPSSPPPEGPKSEGEGKFEGYS